MAGIDEGAPNGCARGDIEVGIVEHEHRIFASEFQHDRQEAGGGNLRDPFAGWNTASEDELVDFGVEKRGTGCTVAHNYLEDFFRNSGRVQEGCQFQRNQRCEFRGLQHHCISSDHSGQRVDGGNGQRIVPGGNNGNHAVGLAQDTPFFRLHRNAAVRDRLFAEKCERVVDEETGGVEDDQDFGQQGFHVRLAGFLRDESGDFGFVFVQEPLKFSENANALFDAERGPCGLRGVGPGYGGVHFGIRGAIQFSQQFAGRRIGRGDPSGRDFNICRHADKQSLRGRGHLRQTSRALLILDAYQKETAGGSGRAGCGAIAGSEDGRNILRLQRSFADQNKSSHQIAHHVMEETTAADGVDKFIILAFKARRENRAHVRDFIVLLTTLRIDGCKGGEVVLADDCSRGV